MEAPRGHLAMPPCRSSSMEGSMSAVSSFALLAILSASSDTVLLQFASQRCQHCQSMQPIVARLVQQGSQLQVINVDQQPEAAQQFKVSGVPTFVAVSGGREIGRIEGVTSYEKLAALTKSATGSPQEPAARVVTGARGLQEAGVSPDQSARTASVRLKVEDATGYGF